MSWRVLIVSTTLCAVTGCATEPPRPDPAETWRPRIGQIVDADTGRPIEGAIVLEVFYLWPRRGFGNFPVAKVFRDSAETTTDQQGRFTLNGPFDKGSWWTDALHIFKTGYGPWRFREEDTEPPFPRYPADTRLQWLWLQQAWERFTTDGAVIELRPLRNREERIKYADRRWDVADRLEPGFGTDTPYGLMGYFFDVPSDRLGRFQTAIDQERATLGLPPRPLDGHRQPR
jgi:hypothetical protein